ncbi:molybdenum ABC transporter ATP-binding protein [Oceanospirillum sp.]|uniref:molybdenum ABC transporter ATP-binding protein n=1 Tax=Oceanospirillum sp. TaxID=2021254 RepID=UPI003A90FA82
MTIFCRIHLQRAEFSLSADFELPGGGGVTILFGRSGCGKTSLLRAIAGLEPDAVGQVCVNGQSWLNGRDTRPVHQRSLGYVFQEASLFPHLNVRANLLFGYQRVPAGQRQISPDELIELLQLESLLGRYPAELSGGERQRVAIAAALLTSPDLLLMDEPLAALDSTAKGEVLFYLNRLRSRFAIPVIYVTHSVEEAIALGDQMLLMEAGRIVARGGITELLRRTELPGMTGEMIPNLLDGIVTPDTGSLAVDCCSDRSLFALRLKGSSQQLYVVPDDKACDSAVCGQVQSLEQDGIQAGTELRVRIDARDLMLSHRRLDAVSCDNQLAVRIDRIEAEQTSGNQTGCFYRILVSLQASAFDLSSESETESAGVFTASILPRGGLFPAQNLLLRLTRQQIQKMALKEGQTAWVLVNKLTLL